MIRQEKNQLHFYGINQQGSMFGQLLNTPHKLELEWNINNINQSHFISISKHLIIFLSLFSNCFSGHVNNVN